MALLPDLRGKRERAAANTASEKALEGKYVIQSEEPDLGPVQAVEAYKELSEVERSFRQLKDLVEMRPSTTTGLNRCGHSEAVRQGIRTRGGWVSPESPVFLESRRAQIES